ncbi:MAG: DUF393 domain-containing protein [Planctomycetota bacterium]
MSREPFTILIDGDCPLCAKEAKLLAWMDRGRGELTQIDIAEPGFDPSAYGKTMDDVMGHIHGVTADGSVVTGVEVFRRAYASVGWGWLMGWTRLPLARQIADAAYNFFAKHRLRFTGRCEDGRCGVPKAAPESAQ